MTQLNKAVTVFLLSCFCVLSISMIFKTNVQEEISIVVNQKAPSSSDKMDGEVEILLKGGKAPYTLTVITNTRTTSQVYKGEKFTLRNLPKGFYMFNVTDTEGKAATQNITL